MRAKLATSIYALLCLLLCLAVPPLSAQSTQGSMVGSVTDPSGAGIAGAGVQVINQGNAYIRETKTDAQGAFRVSGIEPGLYRVVVTAQGFNALEQKDVDVVSGQVKRVDAALKLGEVSTTVTVEGGISQIETENATLSNVKTARDFAEQPMSIYGRAWSNVVHITAGVQSSSGVEVNGARDTANNFTADGISVNDIVSSRFTPNGFSGDIESFQEVKVITANSSAEYAQVAQFSAVSKSGTNEVHGGLYWGNFNNKFSARSWADSERPAFTNHNMFAVNGGGPVFIPKYYDGRNKTFWYGSYSGARYRVGNRSYLIVPTAGMRTGDFSAFAAGGITLTDPANGQRPFVNNTLPTARLSSISQTVQNLLYPEPNLQGVGDFGVDQNYTSDPGYQFNSDVYSFRGDHRISENNFLFARVGITKTNGDKVAGPLKDGYGDGYLGNVPGRSLVISDTHTFTPALVHELKLGFNRTVFATTDYNFGKDVQSLLGIQGIANPGKDPGIAGMPEFYFDGMIPVAAGSTLNRSGSAQNTYQIIDNVSWFRGRHTIKFGVDLRHMQVNDKQQPLSVRGSYYFDDRLSGLAYANFLLGYPSGSSRGIARPDAYVRSNTYGFYWQDEIRLHPKATLNVGLRYDYQTPWREKFLRKFTFDPSTGNMVVAGSSMPTDLVPAVAATLPIVTASQAGLPEETLMRGDKNNWSPRVGLAIRPFGDTTTVIRAGIGAYTQIWPGLTGTGATGGPWQSEQTFELENPDFASIRFPAPFATTSEFSGLQSISGLNSSYANERTYQWNFSVGRQFWGTAIDIGYVGTKSQNIPFAQNLNLLYPSTTPYSSSRRPYPRFNSATLTSVGASSIYHGFTIQADRRVGRSMIFNLNYTWAKSLSDVDLRSTSPSAHQNQYQRYLERADDGNIRRHQLRFNYVYQLPIGRGQKLLSGMSTVPNAILGGWEVVGISTYYTGPRLSPGFSGSDPANTNQFSGRPDRIGDGNLDSGQMRELIRARKPIFDRSAFVLPESGRGYYGNSARNILTGPGLVNWNVGIHKNWMLAAERAKLQFRWEMFNAFNRPNFANPSTNIQSGSFGLVTWAGAARSMLFGLRLDF
ncbi:MAG: TonB-dependent receptor [Bryobacterales bacterium]|nr:TonB-dependent receptor [Bryobacterales bacterium]